MIDQTTFKEQGFGNCAEACIASILGEPLESIMELDRTSGVRFWIGFHAEFSKRGLEAVQIPTDYIPHVCYLSVGPSRRGSSHMVIMNHGELVHDPHPSRDGIVNVTASFVIVPVEMWKYRR